MTTIDCPAYPKHLTTAGISTRREFRGYRAMVSTEVGRKVQRSVSSRRPWSSGSTALTFQMSASYGHGTRVGSALAGTVGGLPPRKLVAESRRTHAPNLPTARLAAAEDDSVSTFSRALVLDTVIARARKLAPEARVPSPSIFPTEVVAEWISARRRAGVIVHGPAHRPAISWFALDFAALPGPPTLVVTKEISTLEEASRLSRWVEGGGSLPRGGRCEQAD